MTMSSEEIFTWGMSIMSEKIITPPFNSEIMEKLRTSFNKASYVRCSVCQGQLIETLDCSYCEHKRDELSGNFL